MALRSFDPYNDRNPDRKKWIVYLTGYSDKVTGIDEWLKRRSPSLVRQDEGYCWISVKNLKKRKVKREGKESTPDNEHTDDHDGTDETAEKGDTAEASDSNETDTKGIDGTSDSDDTDELRKSWKEHIRAKLPVNYETIKALALKHNKTTGKWILFTNQGGKVDYLWSLVAKCVVKNDNPCKSAKVSPFKEALDHVICIYNNDFTNLDEVLESERAIRKMGIKCKLQYKPDAFTHLSIYAKNEWNLKPFIMKSQFNLLTNSSIIEDFR